MSEWNVSGLVVEQTDFLAPVVHDSFDLFAVCGFFGWQALGAAIVGFVVVLLVLLFRRFLVDNVLFWKLLLVFFGLLFGLIIARLLFGGW